MVKFLSGGGQYRGADVPLCSFWRNDLKTDPSQDIAKIESTGQTFAQEGKGKDSAIGSFTGQCIANAYFPKDDITCFNEGNCNNEGKCLPCSKYRYGGMKMAISHSPPLDILRSFAKGLTEAEVQSPNLAKFPPSAVNLVEQDQLPYHILIRNIQAEIAKCCHWSGGDGAPSKFYLAAIRNGPNTATITGADGKTQTLRGISVKHNQFPDQVGTFFPVGTVVVAGFEDQPSFYLEPRTGLVKLGADILYDFETGAGAGATAVTQIAKSTAVDTSDTIVHAVRSAGLACVEAGRRLNTETSFHNNALNTNDPSTIASAQAKLTEATTNESLACTAAADSTTQGEEAFSFIAEVVEAEDAVTLGTAAESAADKFDELADTVEIAASAVGGSSAANEITVQVRLLRISARQLRYSAKGGVTKCSFFFETGNIARIWNSPEDGSLPCNGVRTDCAFYTGEAWQFATDPKMELGRPILAEQIQEIRFRSDDWDRFGQPEVEFQTRFTTPFIWAFEGYVDVGGEPDVEDMLLYRPKVLFARSTSVAGYETLELNKVEVSDFTNFAVAKTRSRVQPGSDTLDKSKAPLFPSVISRPVVPTATRLSITHPRPDTPFIYRMWSPDKNKITLFGKASPEQTVYIINDTALRRRNDYHVKFGTKDFFDVPSAIPLAPQFIGLTGTELLSLTDILQQEKLANLDIEAPLGFDRTGSNLQGFWESVQEVDLVHNSLNDIYVFLIAEETRILSARVTVDCRFLHSIPTQTSFTATDFSMNNIGTEDSDLGTNSSDTTTSAILEVSSQQMIGNSEETVGFGYGYYAWRFKNRGLKFGILNADSDLTVQNPVADDVFEFLITEAAPSEFVVNVSYNVVQYSKENVEVTDWYVVNDCGFIMMNIQDLNIHRVMPLPSQQGTLKAIPDIFINSGGIGSEIAQWGLTKIILTTQRGEHELVQFYRDPDGFGLPANYVLVGPALDASEQNSFGRPNPETDSLTVSFTFLRPQSTKHSFDDTSAGDPTDTPVLDETVVTENFYNDGLRTHRHAFAFSDGSLTAGGSVEETRISRDQQDYVFVYTDSEGRPIGRKYSQFYVMYYNLSCLNVEIFYKWSADCSTYALIPDLFTRVGDSGGTMSSPPDATLDPEDTRLDLGFRVKNLLGDRDCTFQPNCGDHEFIQFGPLRKEFEVIAKISEDDGSTTFKAFFPSAGQGVEGEIISSQRPGSQFLRRHGPMWFPYTVCERPRYQFNTNGPLFTDSTELINITTENPGIVSDGKVILEAGVASIAGQGGSFGGLPDASCEAYHGPDQNSPQILDIHPSLRPCTSAYTYGNQVLKGGNNRFSGYARKRGIIDQTLYAGATWKVPPFGNQGRARLLFELSTERGDFIGGFTGQQIGRRWMPMFPTRPNLGATVGSFSEELESQAVRTISQTTPVAAISETIPTSSTGGLNTLGVVRHTHKQLLVNKAGASINFPFSPYFPMFLPDTDIGKDPGPGRSAVESSSRLGPISTMWAWREQEKNIQRGVTGGEILQGISLAVPDYFIDNRRMEVRLRPEEATYVLRWFAPTYNLDGTVKNNAFLQLSDGPRREIIIDFATRTFGIAIQEDTVYDSSKQLGDVPFPCVEDTPTDNLQQSALCSCITDITDSTLQGPPVKLPSRFIHLDELAPDNFTSLYSSSTMQTPFALDIPRKTNLDPCCMCNYYIPGIFFSLNSEFLPSVTNINPVFDSRVNLLYTWSRVPHGAATGVAVDGVWNSFENRSENLISADQGDIFTNRILSNQGRLDPSSDGGAIFPSKNLAEGLAADDQGIGVTGVLPSGHPKLHGARSVDDDDNSRGQDESIVMTMLFDTYVRVTKVEVTFYAGVGFQAPKYQLGVVPFEERLQPGGIFSNNTTLIIGTTTAEAIDGDIGDSENRSAEDIKDGRAKFVSTIIPSYASSPFWLSYGMEWKLIFPARGFSQSMGIASITLTVDGVLDGFENTELIGIRERKYYRSTGTVPGDLNPERFLSSLDQATVYWRTSEIGSFEGHNRHRAYAWGSQFIDNNFGIIESSDIEFLELLQSEEYDNARQLLSSPYQFIMAGFTPLDEQVWLDFLNEGTPSWTLTLINSVSNVEGVLVPGRTENPQFYGIIPKRVNFNAPGHTWVHSFEESYIPCCLGCADSQVINFDFLHLHDNLSLVETAAFWSELPSGFTRLIRSTIMLPDPTLQGGEGGVGSTILLPASAFQDPQGNAISLDVLEAAGFSRDPTTGQLYVDGGTPNSGVGGPAGISKDAC